MYICIYVYIPLATQANIANSILTVEHIQNFRLAYRRSSIMLVRGRCIAQGRRPSVMANTNNMIIFMLLSLMANLTLVQLFNRAQNCFSHCIVEGRNGAMNIFLAVVSKRNILVGFRYGVQIATRQLTESRVANH